MTVHRSQGATVERTHALEDGGGRELAYVKMEVVPLVVDLEVVVPRLIPA